MDWAATSIHDQLLAVAGEGITRGRADYYAAVTRLLVAARHFRDAAAMKQEDIEWYDAAMGEFDAASAEFEAAAERVARRPA